MEIFDMLSFFADHRLAMVLKFLVRKLQALLFF